MANGAREDRAWSDANVYGWLEYPRSDTDDDWEALIQEHTRLSSRTPRPDERDHETPLRRIVEIVREHGCQTVLIENRYVDADYRSEYSRYWSLTFRGRPAFARRLHFFRSRIAEEDLGALPEEPELGYLGYTVLRPVPSGPVGRTVITPPESTRRAVLATVEDTVHLFGQALAVVGVPFCQQDGQFLRCAHVAAWMCHYSAYRRGLTGRQVTASFADAAPASLSFERLAPSQGMNTIQLQSVFRAFNLPAFIYDLDHLPSVAGVDDPPRPELDELGNDQLGGQWDTRLFSIACRHLNGGYPVLVTTATDHAFTLVGWKRSKGVTTFIANDDVEGPYKDIPSPFEDGDRVPWLHFMIPVPPNVFLGGESAENSVVETFRSFADDPKVSPETSEIGRALLPVELTEDGGVLQRDQSLNGTVEGGNAQRGVLNVRTGLCDGSAFKALAEERGFEGVALRLIRRDLALSHWVWVTEIHDPRFCGTGEPCVVAEAVCDATSEDSAPNMLLWVLPEGVFALSPELTGAPRTSPDTPRRWRPNFGTCLPPVLETVS